MQGCPLSPYLFILTAEVLAKAGRKNENIRGINVNDKEIKISQYADDTTLILDGSNSFLLSPLSLLDDFFKVSGLRLNNNKTEAFWIGANCLKEEIRVTGRDFKWPKSKVKALGVWFSLHPKETLTLNNQDKIL